MNIAVRKLSSILFLILFAAFAFWGARNHRLKMDSDPSSYLRFAAALAKGSMYLNYPPDRVFEGHYPPRAILKGTYSTLIHEGRGMAYYSIGYPLYLALFLLAGGKYAPFFANLVAFLALLALLRAVTLRIFRDHPAGPAAALMAPALYWLFGRKEVSYLLAPYRDPLAHALILGSVLCFLAWLEEPRRLRPALLGGLLFGLALTVRETAALAALPIGLLGLRSMVAGRWLPGRGAVGAIALGVGLAALPLLVQNYKNTGNPFYPTQMLEDQVRYGVVREMDEDKPVQMKGLRLAHFPKTAPGVVREVLRDHNPLFIALVAIGLWAGRSNPAVWFLLLPFIVVHALFFGCYIRTMWRYVFVTQLAAVPLAAFGAASGAALLGRFVRFDRLHEAVAAGTALVAAGLLVAGDEGRTFRVPQAEAFRRDLEASVPAGAVVLAERPLRDVIDLTTRAYGVRVEEIVREDAGLPLSAGLGFFERSFSGLFFLDSMDGAQKKGYDQTPVTRLRILSRYDLTRVAEFEAARYGLNQEFGRPRVTLYRLDPWRGTASVGSVDVGAGGAGILRLDGREVAPGGGQVAAEILLGGRPVGTGLSEGLNWYFVTDAPPTGVTEVRVTASVALPRDLDPVWYGPDSPIVLEAGPDAMPLDRAFLSAEFLDPRDRTGERLLEREGVVRVPALQRAGSSLVLSALVGSTSEIPGQRIAFSGGGAEAEFALASLGALRVVSLPITGSDPGGTTAAIRVRPLAPPGTSVPQPVLVDRFAVSRLRFAGPPLRIGFGPAAEPHVVEGLYEPEMHLDRHLVRWTAGTARIRLPAAAEAASREWKLSLRYFGPPAAVRAPRLRIALDGEALGEFPVAPDVAQEVSCTVRRGLLRAGLNELSVESTPWRPAELLRVNDHRTLGVMLEWLEIARGEERP